MAESLEDIRARLDAIAEELADLALSCLRQAVSAGETKAPAQEHRLTRARRAVEKASQLLGPAGVDT